MALCPFRVRLHAAAGVPLGAIFGGIAVLAAGAAAFLQVDRWPWAICFFKAATGWPCLTCGSTRALAHLVRLDVTGALALNPLATLGCLALIPWAAADLVLMPKGQALVLDLPSRWRAPVGVAAVAALIANWAYLVAAGL